MFVADGTAADVVRAALHEEDQLLLLSSASDLGAMADDWLSGIENHFDILDQAFGFAALALEISEAELRASWISRTEQERRRWVERVSMSADAPLAAASHALLRALDDDSNGFVAELDGLLQWLPQRDRLVFGLEVSGPAAIRSLFAFVTQHVQQPVIALVDARLWNDVREQLDDRTRAQLESGRIPILTLATEPQRPAAPIGETSTRRTTARSSPAELDDERARSAAELRLLELLQAEPVTRDLFKLNVQLPFTFGPARAEVDFVCNELRLVLEVDGYFHFQRSDAYRRDRRKDVLLQHQGYLVSRHLAEDVHERGGEVMRAVRELVLRRRRSFRRENAK